MKVGFDSKKYLNVQIKAINKRLKQFDRLYLEFGGKLLLDMHASRVMPGYNPKNKLKILKSLKNKEIIYCVGAKNIESGKRNGDKRLTHDIQALKDISELKKNGFNVDCVAITRYSKQPKVDLFVSKLKKLNLKYVLHDEIRGYTKDVKRALRGYERHNYFQTNKNLIVVTGVGSGSGKMAFCLSQIYQEKKRSINSGFAKLETFPIWNLDLDHPINIAYEAATADWGDYNLLDQLHWENYKIRAINYNRDVENFKILKKVFGREKNFFYKSPTDMGINMAKIGIINDRVCREASLKEIKRRYFVYAKEVNLGKEKKKVLIRMKSLFKKAGIS